MHNLLCQTARNIFFLPTKIEGNKPYIELIFEKVVKSAKLEQCHIVEVQNIEQFRCVLPSEGLDILIKSLQEYNKEMKELSNKIEKETTNVAV